MNKVYVPIQIIGNYKLLEQYSISEFEKELKTNMGDEHIQQVLKNNEEWANSKNSGFFTNLSKGQCPKIVWFGCSDSRVPAELITKSEPGDIFVHRNIANQFNHADLNALSVLEYAVNHLNVEHVVVCGHTGCGGVCASMDNNQHGLVDNWLRNIKDIYHANKQSIESHEKKVDALVDLNVKQQVHNISATNIVQDAWRQNKKLTVHGWVYSLETGKLKSLITVKNEHELRDPIYKVNPSSH